MNEKVINEIKNLENKILALQKTIEYEKEEIIKKFETEKTREEEIRNSSLVADNAFDIMRRIIERYDEIKNIKKVIDLLKTLME